MGRPKKVIDDIQTSTEEIIDKPECLECKPKTEKEKLLELYDLLKGLGIRSIGDLENLIARAE